ncbi:uncharacterized protein LOC124111981 isoform X2 [Haliotis rufescens]|uniref:uncharacterized protein LOC124111981 isoform X2 n=1 Tax=Haliotis rufescens TaxID=6454 RepID=UPI00201F0EC9|nr:uncharacterized protein LOC124111981 isoform X2 [Haliotis rufescens]
MASAGNTGSVYFSWIFLVFILNCLCLKFVISENLTFWLDPAVNEDTTHSDYNVGNRRINWWDAAQSGCSQFGGNLYIPQSQNLPGALLGQMNWGTYYWIGAVKYPTWIWTADQSNLYTYVGYLPLPTFRQNSTLEGNSALTCHQYCGKSILGLRGNDCYCLGNFVHGIPSFHFGVRCPGNYDEYCGDEDGISVYKQESIRAIPSFDSKCGFISVSKTWPNINNPYSYTHGNLLPTTYYHTVSLESNCYTTRRSACEKNITRHIVENRWTWTCRGNVCLSHAHRTFYASNQKCDLVKVTHGNIEHLTQAIVELSGYRETYWIGLQRISVKKWNNGSDMLLTADDYFGVGAVLPTCLAVWKTYYNSVQFHWLECQSKHLSICEKVKVRTTKPPTRMSTHSTNSPTPPHIDPLSTSDVVHPSSTHRTTTKKSKLEGIYVGCSIAAAVICVSLILLLVSYRQRRLCFKDKRSVSTCHNVHFNYAADNATYSEAAAPTRVPVGLEMPVSSDSSPYYSVVPVARVTPNNHANGSSRQDPEIEKQRDYYNIKPVENSDAVSGSQQLPDNGQYVVPKVGMSKTTGKHPVSRKPVAHYQNTEQPDYAVPRARDVEVDGTRDDDNAGIYHLAGEVDQDNVYTLSRAIDEHSRDTTMLEAPYNTLGQDMTPGKKLTGTGTYDRLIHPSKTDACDPVSRDRHMKIGDNTYSHIGQGDHDADNNYDTTRHRQQRPSLDDYSHTDVLNAVSEDGEDDGEDVDDTYHFINDTEEANATHGKAHPVYSNTGNTHAQAVDDADYYNLPFVTDRGNANSSEDPASQGGDDVYSLARTVSDA